MQRKWDKPTVVIGNMIHGVVFATHTIQEVGCETIGSSIHRGIAIDRLMYVALYCINAKALESSIVI